MGKDQKNEEKRRSFFFNAPRTRVHQRENKQVIGWLRGALTNVARQVAVGGKESDARSERTNNRDSPVSDVIIHKIASWLGLISTMIYESYVIRLSMQENIIVFSESRTSLI